MSKAVMISIQPKWCELIASGKKTIEIRKTAPKMPTPFKCYIYMTKNGNKPIKVIETQKGIACLETDYKMAGTVIGEFVCDRIYDILPHNDGYDINQYECGWKWGEDDSCLTFKEFLSYLSINNGYGLHISDLKIYDKPKELGEFEKPCDYSYNCRYCNNATHFANFLDLTTQSNGFTPCNRHLSHPPQSWMYVEEAIIE